MNVSRSFVASSFLALLAAVASGCADRTASSDSVHAETRDSAGITIIEHTSVETLPALGWTVGPAPEVSIGDTGGDAAYELFGVEDAMRLSDGRILLTNAGTSEIRVFDAQGVHLSSWGREGEGPGEYTGLTDLAEWPGDSILAWDFFQNRLTLYDRDGAVGRTDRLTLGEGEAAAEFSGILPDGTILTASLLSFAPGEQTSGLVRRSRNFARVDPAGIQLSDFGEHVDEEYWVHPEVGAIVRHPFRRSVHSAVWNDRVIISGNDRFELRAYDPSGVLDVIIRVDHPMIPVSSADVAEIVEARLSEADDRARATLERVFEDMPPVESFPAFSEIVVDSEGDLWVRQYVRPPGERSSWVVFESDGTARGVIELPAGLDVYRIGQDYVLGKSTDDFDVEHVQLWRLQR